MAALARPTTKPSAAPAAEIARILAERIGENRYKLWFESHTHFVRTPDAWIVGVPNRHFQEWLEQTFSADVMAAAREADPEPAPVKFVIDPELFRKSREEQAQVEAVAKPAAKVNVATVVEETKPAPIKPRTGRQARSLKGLGDFIVGACNRVAHASAMGVVEEPACEANPLVIHGPVGTGKTHLLEGIATGLRRHHPGLKSIFLTAEEFMNRFLGSVNGGKQSAFRRQFRECDVLLLDDLDFFEGKKATQIEFLHTFDALVAQGSQIVLSCDCHPRLSDELTPELIDRLIGGAVWGLTPPDAETRLAILRAKAAASKVMIPDDVLKFVAQKLRGNVRELEGALHTLRHHARVGGDPLTVRAAQDALADLLRHAAKVVRLPDIDAAVYNVLGVAPSVLRSKSRAFAVSHPRMVAVYLARKHTAATYGEIAAHFGNKTHSTSVAAEKKVRQWLADDAGLKCGERTWKVRELVARIEGVIGG